MAREPDHQDLELLQDCVAALRAAEDAAPLAIAYLDKLDSGEALSETEAEDFAQLRAVMARGREARTFWASWWGPGSPSVS